MSAENQAKLTLWSLRRPRWRFLIALALVVAFAGGAVLDRYFLFSGVPADAVGDFRLMAEAWNTINRFYVDRGAVQHGILTTGAIGGMTDALGDTGHSSYLTRKMLGRANDSVHGKFTGIGIEVQMKDRRPVVVAPIDGSPAQRAGVQPGDIILEVDHQSVANMPLSQLVTHISGLSGTTVAVRFLDPKNGDKRELTIPRAVIKMKNVVWQQLPGTSIAQLRIGMFSEGVGGETRDAIRDIQKQGLRGVILDLRNDPGGALDEAVTVASQFLTNGNVLLEKNAEGKTVPIRVQPGGAGPTIPMMVLINGGSASASEIVAGAMHDANRAMLVGETTFGTGTVLTQFPLSDGSALLLAVEEWLTPSGRSFWHHGIVPDVAVPMAREATLFIPGLHRDITPEAFRATSDLQLLKAVSLLEKENGSASRH